MKYENASELLPKELLKEVQKYAAGKLLYIPSGEEKRGWGEMSGYREQLRRRNQMIRNKYAHGITVSELADEYFLSLDSIKKIIYSKNNEHMLPYTPWLESAVHYAHVGMLEEWVQCYLMLTLKESDLAQKFIQQDTIYFGVIKFPLRLIQWEAASHHEEEESIDSANDILPLLVQYIEGRFYCKTQMRLLASLKRARVNAYPSIVVLKGNAEYKRFMQYYGNVFIYVN